MLWSLRPVFFGLYAIALMPDCHGSEKLRFGSQTGCRRFGWRFFSFILPDYIEATYGVGSAAA